MEILTSSTAVLKCLVPGREQVRECHCSA